MENWQKHWVGREDLLQFLGKAEMTTCEPDGSIKNWKCQREEQCDSCWLIDHKKECKGCEYYDHENH